MVECSRRRNLRRTVAGVTELAEFEGLELTCIIITSVPYIGGVIRNDRIRIATMKILVN
jgi:hypothetical protein